MYPIEINTWYNCIPAKEADKVELCKICRTYGSYPSTWHIVTYYDDKEVYSGTLNDCLHWINNHYTERRYYN